MNKHTVPGDAGYDYRRFDKVNIAQKIIKVLLISTWNTAKLIEEILLLIIFWPLFIVDLIKEKNNG